MNRNLEELIRAYALGFNAEACLLGVSMATLKSMLIDLLAMYFNDLNSSTLREIVVALVSGYQPYTAKQGYNGYRYDALTGDTEDCEIKPVNVRTDSTNTRRLNGGGNYTDFTNERLEGHKGKNPTMLVAGFVDGRLIYVCEFKFNEPTFLQALEEDLNKQFSEGRRRGTFRRSTSFDLRHYKDGASFKVRCYVSKEQLTGYKKHLSRDMFKLLMGVAE